MLLLTADPPSSLRDFRLRQRLRTDKSADKVFGKIRIEEIKDWQALPSDGDKSI